MPARFVPSSFLLVAAAWSPVPSAQSARAVPTPQLETIPCPCPPAWQLIGNSNTLPLSHFLGTTDDKPLSLRVFNRRAMRYAFATNGTFQGVNVLGGCEINQLANGVVGATIAGGGQDLVAGTDLPNVVAADLGSIGGGAGNALNGYAGTIAGGESNSVEAPDAAIGGGRANTANGTAAAVAGGDGNGAGGAFACVAGGQANSAAGDHSAVGGGLDGVAGGAASVVAGGSGGLASGVASVVSGGQQNVAGGDYSTVGGGLTSLASGALSTIGGGESHAASASHTTIGGGQENTASESGATVAGGRFNAAANQNSFVGGGYNNVSSGVYSAVAGGTSNNAGGEASAIAGGLANDATGGKSAVGGGSGNVASGNWSAVPGGMENTAAGEWSLAAGLRASAQHQGSFVWADSTGLAQQSSSADQFTVRASGGARVYSDAGSTTGVLLASGAGSWTSASDRAAKTDVEPVDGREVLERLAGVPISTWSYRTQDGVRHMGPMAQDFYAAFGLGLGEKTIDTVDPDGVALAAIQGLREIVLEQREEIARLEERLAALERRE